MLTDRGDEILTWAAIMVRPHLDDTPERTLPDGVEVRPVTAGQDTGRSSRRTGRRSVVRGTTPNRPPRRSEFGSPTPTTTRRCGTSRGARHQRRHAENIATDHEWRHRGIAGALLALSLCELRDPGMTEAASSVDTSNPGVALPQYVGIGFEPAGHSAVYVRPVS